MNTKCILFDIDGLMADSEQLTFTLIREILRERGLDMTLDFYRQTIGVDQKIGARLFTDTYPGIDGQKDVYDVFETRYEAAALLLCNTLIFRQLCQKQFGGITGDLAGFYLQISEIIILAACALF